MQKTIGEVLKSKRKTLNLTLDDIQQRTKVQKRYLQQIENDQFDLLPSSFYTRAFIRQYAKAVDIDDAPLIDAFTNERLVEIESKNPEIIEPTAEYSSSAQFSSRDYAASRTQQYSKSWLDHLPAIILSLLAIIILSIVIFVVIEQTTNNNRLKEESYSIATSENASSEVTSSSEADEPVSSEPVKEKDNQLAIANTTNRTITINATRVSLPAKLTITAKDSGRSWVSIIDGTTQANLLGYAGTNGITIGANEDGGMSQEASLTSQNTLVNVILGNKTNLSVTLNGQSIDLSSVPDNLTTNLVINIAYKS
ncbi:MAG: helix-turn-helix domain-containing protein [Streptococcaceae bacterium]|jgi:cytoskeletal protein RodZ|nr:helix-turn-helix domain-containing protein [Streptococcaceae bacterium]